MIFAFWHLRQVYQFLSQFISCSTDSTYSHFAWLLGDFAEEGIVAMGNKLNFTMIGDKTKIFPKLLDVLDESTNTAKHAIVFIDGE